jgi:universal stress protein A
MEKIYQRIMLAVDLHPACDAHTTQRAQQIANDFNGELYLIHAIEHINAYGVAQAYPSVLDLEDEMIKDAQAELARWGEKLGVPSNRQFVEIGSPKFVIINKAQELKIELIVVGSHGRHGLGLLLGSTANAVLHHAPCDVLAVRVDNHKDKH